MVKTVLAHYISVCIDNSYQLEISSIVGYQVFKKETLSRCRIHPTYREPHVLKIAGRHDLRDESMRSWACADT